MIRLSVVDGDLLDSVAQAVMLPIDGVMPANASAALVVRSLGRIARAFARRYPDSEAIDEIESQVSFPLQLGRAAPVVKVADRLRFLEHGQA